MKKKDSKKENTSDYGPFDPEVTVLFREYLALKPKFREKFGDRFTPKLFLYLAVRHTGTDRAIELPKEEMARRSRLIGRRIFDAFKTAEDVKERAETYARKHGLDPDEIRDRVLEEGIGFLD